MVPEFAGALEAPAATADAKANVSSFNVSLNSKIVRSVYLNAGYRYYNFADKTQGLEFEEGYARLDQVWEDIAVETEPISYQRSRLFVNVSCNMLKHTSFNLGYTYSSIDR